MSKESLSIAKPLQAIRKKLRISRARLAEGVCTPGYVELIEKDERSPSLETIAGLANALSCEPTDLLSVPTEERLAEIEIAFKRRELEQLESSEKVESQQKGVA